MFENFHPGFIFFLVGLFACVGSDKLRKMILACGPFLALVAIFNLPLGLEQNFTFFLTHILLSVHKSLQRYDKNMKYENF